MMNPPPHFMERRILHIISCHVSKGTKHCGCSAAIARFHCQHWVCSEASNIQGGLLLYVQLCATIISKRWKSSHTILHGRTKRATSRVAPSSSIMCNESTSTFRTVIVSQRGWTCMQHILCNKRNTTFKEMKILLNPNCSQESLLYYTKWELFSPSWKY